MKSVLTYKRKQIHLLRALSFGLVMQAQTTYCDWKTEASGIWSVCVGNPEKVDLLSKLFLTSKLDAINAMPNAALPINKDDIAFKRVDGETFNYETGAYTRIELKVAPKKNGKLKGEVNIPKGKEVWSYDDFNFNFMTK